MNLANFVYDSTLLAIALQRRMEHISNDLYVPTDVRAAADACRDALRRFQAVSERGRVPALAVDYAPDAYWRLKDVEL